MENEKQNTELITNFDFSRWIYKLEDLTPFHGDFYVLDVETGKLITDTILSCDLTKGEYTILNKNKEQEIRHGNICVVHVSIPARHQKPFFFPSY